MTNKFSFGQLLMTRTVNDTVAENKKFAIDVTNALTKYRNCDWGDTCQEDAKMNDEAVKSNDDRILAVYNTCEGKIWIITEWDRSATTVLFPDEY